MCKVGSTGAGDINSKVYKQETTLKLYKSARRYGYADKTGGGGDTIYLDLNADIMSLCICKE